MKMIVLLIASLFVVGCAAVNAEQGVVKSGNGTLVDSSGKAVGYGNGFAIERDGPSE